jgi:hypothetical protein
LKCRHGQITTRALHGGNLAIALENGEAVFVELE